MSARCCRTTPRCAGCPVRVMAARKRGMRATRTAALVEDVFRGAEPRSVPPSVTLALSRLEVARRAAADRQMTWTP
jgi:hypothetical protein